MPPERAAEYVKCGRYTTDNHRHVWRFVVKSDKHYDGGEYSPENGGAWFQIEVSDPDLSGQFAEAVLAIDDHDDLFTMSGDTGTANGGPPELKWAWSDDKRSIRFAYRTVSWAEFDYSRADGVGTVLVTGSIRCPR